MKCILTERTIFCTILFTNQTVFLIAFSNEEELLSSFFSVGAASGKKPWVLADNNSLGFEEIFEEETATAVN